MEATLRKLVRQQHEIGLLQIKIIFILVAAAGIAPHPKIFGHTAPIT